MEEEIVTGNGLSKPEIKELALGGMHNDKQYHKTLNGKRPPETSPISVESGSSLHHNTKRSKTDMNGYGCDYHQLAANIPVGDLCNGQLLDGSHQEKLNQLVDEQSKRLTESPLSLSASNVTPRLITPAINNLNNNQPDMNSVSRDAATFCEDHRSTTAGVVESEPEIITLSDSEDELREVLSQAVKFTLCNPKTIKMLRRHQQKLRVEESKLILLKKLRDSMNFQHRPATSENVIKSDVRSSTGQMMTHQKTSGNAPPPLKRGIHQSTAHQSISSKIQTHHGMNQQSTLNSHTGKQVSAHSLHTSGSHGSAGPPPLVNMTKNPVNQSNGSVLSYSQSAAATSKKTTAPPPKPPPQLTAEQKLSAAKLILKKQLEQSLQQIPTPKPPPPEVNFLPSLASGEFVYLLGMEEVVKHILTLESKDTKYVVNPFTCVQCSTDFTPVWKRDKPGSKNVICEKCISSKHKKSMRKEHTAKLKATFAKALQNDREIERRINAGSPLSDMPGLNVYASANTITHSRSQTSTSPAPSTPSMPQLAAQQQQQSSHHTSASATTSSSANSQLSTAQLQQHQQALIQAQAAEQMRAMLAAQAMALPYQLYGVSNKQAAELQRQYLLDMINPRSWKT